MNSKKIEANLHTYYDADTGKWYCEVVQLGEDGFILTKRYDTREEATIAGIQEVLKDRVVITYKLDNEERGT